MLSEVRKNISYPTTITLAQSVSFFLGLILIAAIPYSAGAAKNWYLPILDGYYRINFFYLAEIIIYGIAFFVYGIHFKTKTEKIVFISIIGIIISRIISVFFADKFQLIQLVSIFRYIEVFLCIYVLTNLLSKKKNRSAFLVGLTVGVLLESVIGFLKFTLSSGALRGIFMGIPSYQLQLLFIFALMLLAPTKNKYILIACITILILGIISTQTRSGLLQFAMGLIIVVIYAYRKKIVNSVFPIVIFSIIASVFVSYTFKSITSGTTQRVTEAIEGGGTIAYRFYLWDKGLGAFLSHPVTGIGTGGFGKQLGELPQVFNVPMEGERRTKPISAHSTIISIMAETGMLGLIAYSVWVFAIFRIIVLVFKNPVFDAFAVSGAIMMTIFIACDTWSVNSFFPTVSFIAAYLLGYLRENNSE